MIEGKKVIQEKRIDSVKDIKYILLLIALTMICFFFTQRIWERDLSAPYWWEGDQWFVTYELKNVTAGHFSFFPRSSFPFGYTQYMYDFALTMGVMGGIAFLTKSIAFAYNLYWILTYVCVSVCTFYFLRKLHISYYISISGSVIYAFLPWHFYRYGHIGLMGYYSVPLVGMMMLHIISQEKLTRKEILFDILVAIFVGLDGMYLAGFSAMVIFFAGMFSIRDGKFYRFFYAVGLASLFLVMTIILCIVIPTIFDGGKSFAEASLIRNGPNAIQEWGYRLYSEFFPINNYRIPKLWEWKKDFYGDLWTGTVFAHENDSCGLFMLIGFIAMLWETVIAKKSEVNDYIRCMGRITLMLIAVCTTYGINTFVAYHVSAVFRSYCRINVFIGLFSLATICILLDSLCEKLSGIVPRYLNLAAWILSGMFLVIAVWDQTPDKSAYKWLLDEDAKWSRDLAFGKKLEDYLGEEAVIYDMPFRQDKYLTNVLFFTRDIKIGSANMAVSQEYKRMGDLIEKKSREDALEDIAELGFTAIMLTPDVFTDRRECYRWMEYLNGVCEKKPLKKVEGNQILYFYDISEYTKNKTKDYTDAEIKDIVADYVEAASVKFEGLFNENQTIAFNVINISLSGTNTYIYVEHNQDMDFSLEFDDGEKCKGKKYMEDSAYCIYIFDNDNHTGDAKLHIAGEGEDFCMAQVSNITDGAIDEEKLQQYDDIYGIENAGRSLTRVKLVQIDYAGDSDVYLCGDGNIQYKSSERLFYGPYKKLTKGIYEINIYGENLDDFEIYFTKDIGKYKVDGDALKKEQNHFVYKVDARHEIKDFEVILRKKGNRGILYGYTIESNG